MEVDIPVVPCGRWDNRRRRRSGERQGLKGTDEVGGHCQTACVHLKMRELK